MKGKKKVEFPARDLTFFDYQELAHQFAHYPDIGPDGSFYLAAALAGEAGELVNEIKKIVRDGATVIDREKLADIAHELGDILWYWTELCTRLGISPEQVAKLNIEKLDRKRSKK